MVEVAKSPTALGFGLKPAADPRGMSLPEYFAESAKVATVDAIEAELVPPTAFAELDWKQQQAATRGIIQSYVKSLDYSDPSTPAKLKMLKGAIRSQDLATINRIDPKLGKYLSIYEGKPREFSDFNEFTYNFLAGQSDISEVESAFAKAEADAALARTLESAEQGVEQVRIGLQDSLFNADPTSVGAIIDTHINQIAGLNSQISLAPNEEAKTSLAGQASALEGALIDGVIGLATRGMGQERIDVLTSAIVGRQPDLLEPSERSAYNAIMKVRGLSGESGDKINSALDTARENARGVDVVAASNADAFVQTNITPNIASLEYAVDLSSIANGYNTLTSALSSVSGLKDEDRSKTLRELDIAAARGMLNNAFSAAGNEQTVIALRNYAVTGTDSPLLTDDMRAAVAQAKLYAQNTGLQGFFDSEVAGYSENRNRVLDQQAADLAFSNNINRLKLGLGQPTQESDRVLGDSLALNFVNTELVKAGETPLSALPPDIWTNSAYVDDPRYANAFKKLYGTRNVMPQGLLMAGKAMAAGNLQASQGYSPAVIQAHLKNFATVRSASGFVPNPAMNAFTVEELGRLSLIEEIDRVAGSEAQIGPLFAAATNFMADAAFPEKAERFLGKPINDFVQESLGDTYFLLTAAQRESVNALTSFTIAQSMSSGGLQQTPDNLAYRISKQVDEMFPSGEGYVVEYDSSGVPSGRTRYALASQVGANEVPNFIKYVQTEMNKFAPAELKGLSFRPPSRGIMDYITPGPRIIAALVSPGDNNPYLELVAGGPDGIGGVGYFVHKVDPKSGIRSQVFREDGKGALIVSTADPAFSISHKRRLAELELEKAKADRDIYSGALADRVAETYGYTPGN
jgi:hypothetical protein